MKETRWLRWVGPGALALVAAASIGSVATGAGPRAWVPEPCPDEPGDRVAAARAAGPVRLDDVAQEAWFRLDPRLDQSGVLAGQRLALGLDGDRSSRFLDLPAESFAAGPFGRIVLVGRDDGSRSRLQAIDVARQCAWDAGDEADVIRRATIDPAGQVVYEMRVARGSRADLGIWSRPLDGSAPPTPFLEPVEPDERFGTTFSTEFAWELSGARLVVQSCGEIACRTRVVEPGGGEPRTVAEPGLGTLVGLAGDRLVTYAACPGLPCPIVSTDLSTGTSATLAPAAVIAVMVATSEGARVVHEVFDGSTVALRSTALDGSASADIGPVPDGLRLHATPGNADAATRVGVGWVLLSPDGRLPDTGPAARTQLRHVTDGVTVRLEDIAR